MIDPRNDIGEALDDRLCPADECVTVAFDVGINSPTGGGRGPVGDKGDVELPADFEDDRATRFFEGGAPSRYIGARFDLQKFIDYL